MRGVAKMGTRYCLLAVLAMVALALMGTAPADDNETEEAVAFDRSPAAVQKAVKEAYPGATVTKCVRETEDGEVAYEVELRSGKLEAELELDASGTILETETEEEIPLDQLPGAVRDAATRLVKGGKLLEADRVTEHDTVAYEIDVQCGTVVLELTMDGSGKVLSIGVEDQDDDGSDDDDADGDD
jgi:uncharacterized membrane protein YkoI